MDYEFLEAFEAYSGIIIIDDVEKIHYNPAIEAYIKDFYGDAIESVIQGRDETKAIWSEYKSQIGTINKEINAAITDNDWKRAAEKSREGEAMAKKMANAARNIPTTVGGTVLSWICFIISKFVIEFSMGLVACAMNADSVEIVTSTTNIAMNLGAGWNIVKNLFNKTKAEKLGLTSPEPLGPGDFNPFVAGMRGDLMKAAANYAKSASLYDQRAKLASSDNESDNKATESWLF